MGMLTLVCVWPLLSERFVYYLCVCASVYVLVYVCIGPLCGWQPVWVGVCLRVRAYVFPIFIAILSVLLKSHNCMSAEVDQVFFRLNLQPDGWVLAIFHVSCNTVYVKFLVCYFFAVQMILLRCISLIFHVSLFDLISQRSYLYVISVTSRLPTANAFALEYTIAALLLLSPHSLATIKK